MLPHGTHYSAELTEITRIKFRAQRHMLATWMTKPRLCMIESATLFLTPPAVLLCTSIFTVIIAIKFACTSLYLFIFQAKYIPFKLVAVRQEISYKAESDCLYESYVRPAILYGNDGCCVKEGEMGI